MRHRSEIESGAPAVRRSPIFPHKGRCKTAMRKNLTFIFLILLMGIFVTMLSSCSSELTYEESKSALLECLSENYSKVEDVYIDEENISKEATEFSIKDRQGTHDEYGYNFTLRYKENVEGLENRLADDFAVSVDGKIYWYDPANDCHISYEDLDMYNPGTGEWAD